MSETITALKSFKKNPWKLPPNCTLVIAVNSLAGLGRHTGSPSRKLAKSGDYDQPDPPAGPRWHQVSSSRSGRIQGTVVSLIRNPGRSRGHRVSRAAILAGLGTSSLSSRKSWHSRSERPRNSWGKVKCTDWTIIRLDVRRHRSDSG